MSESIATTEEAGTDALRVLLVDDHDLFRTGLRNLLEANGLEPMPLWTGALHDFVTQGLRASQSRAS